MSSHSSEDSIEIPIQFDEKFLVKLTNHNNNVIERSTKQSCKVFQISSEVDIDQKLAIIRKLKLSDYPNLFIFIIENQNKNLLNENQGSKARELEEHLIKFDTSRPLVVLHTFEAENELKFYYKAENTTQFVDIDQHYSVDLGLYEEYTESLQSLLYQDLDTLEDQILKKLSCIKDLSIVIRFLKTMDIQEAYFYPILMKIAENGSKADLLAVLDASFTKNGRMLSNQAQNYVRWDFKNDESSDDDQNRQDKGSEILLDEDQDTQSKKKDSRQSVLLIAVQHSNQEIIDYLVTYCTHLIQQLPVEHQIRVSTEAFDSQQFDVLCDLLNTSDFPFPGKFTFTKSKINENLQKITEERMELKAAIDREDFFKIDNFINGNQNHKFIYSINNNSALTEAANARQFGVFYYLKSLGFQGENCQEMLNELKKEEKITAIEKAAEQRKTNIKNSLLNCHRSVYNLCGKSLIHNRKIKEELEAKYREHIKSWFISIHKIAPEMLNVAASCEHLKIIFDFESFDVENASLDSPSSLGTSYSTQKWIFIGAKFTDREQRQTIKGVLAHELCHYVMGMVYENQESPYFKGDKITEEIFNGIVAILDKWSTTKDDEPDDECDEIISTVYSQYPNIAFVAELIVRVVNILAQYDDDQEKSDYLKEKYKILFDFWYNHVVPEMLNYFKREKVAIRVNTTVGLLDSITRTKDDYKIKFLASTIIEQLAENKATIATTNVPRLLLINIYSHLERTSEYLLKSQNLFLEPEKITNEQVWMDLRDLHFRDVKLNAFVDCSKENLENWTKILGIKKFNFILVAANEKQTTKLKNICNKNKINPETLDINYKWNDLTEESQLKLLNYEVTFQNKSNPSLMELLSKPTDGNKLDSLSDYSDIINDQLFNLLIDKEKVCLNSFAEDELIQNKTKVLYQMRTFLKKGVNFKNEISQEKLISITEKYKYVLISDIAGSGKSWVIKNISELIRNQSPTRWVTCVDLKEFIEEFKKQDQNLKPSFGSFFVEKILRPKTEFEAKIFKKLYKIGKVSIVFDAFDEIAPDCAEFVANLAESFESNDGNQLWIVTRDYFEIDLQEKLGIKNVYKLNEFTEQEGIDFIATNWILMDLKVLKGVNFEKLKQNSPNLTKYQEKAAKIVQNVTVSNNQSIGLPQLFSMIASGYKDDNFKVEDLKRAKIFTQFVNKLYKRWIYDKGELNIERNINSQHYMLGFMRFHHYCAIASLFPERVDSLFPDHNESEWPEEDIIACGIVIKIGSTYSFVHETFREFFAADFIFKSLKDPRVLDLIINFMIQVLTIQKYGIIRMFLNDFVDNYSAMENVQLELNKSVEKICKMENFSEFFTENQEHLVKLIIEILRKGNYENVRKLLSDNFKAVATKTMDPKMFLKFSEFLLSFLKDEDTLDIIKDQKILHEMIGSNQELEVFENFVAKLENKFGFEFIQQELKVMQTGDEAGNIFYRLVTTENLSQQKVQQFFEIIQKYLNKNEIIELIDTCTQNVNTIFKILANNSRNFKPFFDGAETYFNDRKLFQKLKNIVWKTDSNDQHILHWSAVEKGIEFYIALWSLIQKTFDDKEELKTFVLQKNNLQDTFLQVLITSNKSDVIELTLNKLKEILKQEDYKEFLRSKDQHERSLLHLAAISSKEVKTHQVLWKEIKGTCKFDKEFFEILQEVDENCDNVIGLAATLSSAEILKFMQVELDKIKPKENTKKLLINLGNKRRNLLQGAAQQNKSLELHVVLWDVLKNYFNSSELLEFIRHREAFGDNLLLNLIYGNTQEVKELTWNEIKEQLERLELTTEAEKENIQKCEKIIKIDLNTNKLQKDEIEILKLKWIKNENLEETKLFDEATQKLMKQKLKIVNLKNIEILKADQNIENHKKLWENLTFKNREAIENLATEMNVNGNNFIHLLVIFNTAEVIEFTLKKFKENLYQSDYNKLLRSKGEFRRNFLQIAAMNSNKVRNHQILWQKVRESCKSEEEFIEILEEIDEQGGDIFNHVAALSTGEIFELIYEESVKVASSDKIKNVLKKLGIANRNLLQTAARQNKSLELHKTIWKILKEIFNTSEILKFVKHFDDYGNNLLIYTKEFSTIEIVELAWTEIKEVLKRLYKDTETAEKIKECEKIIKKITESKDKKENKNKITDEEMKFLQLNWIKNQKKSESTEFFSDSKKYIFGKKLIVDTLNNLLPLASKRNIEYHKKFWNYLLKESESSQFLEELVSKINEYGNNFIHLLVISNSADVIELTIYNLKNNLRNSDFTKMLRLKGTLGRNSIQLAASNSKEVKTHQILWKEFRESCKSNEEFSEILKEVDKNNDNVLGLAATFSTGEILKFMNTELERFGKEKAKNLLTHLGYAGRHLLQAAAQQNNSLELNEVVWDILKDYFDDYEILEFIKHRDGHGYNLLLNTLKGNTKEVKELTWNKVRELLVKIGLENNENLINIDKTIKDNKQFEFFSKEDRKIFKLEWIGNENSIKLFEGISVTSVKCLNDLKLFMADPDVENHENYWKQIEQKFSKYEEMKKLLFEKDENGNNFIHFLVIFKEFNILEFTLKKLEEILNEADYQEMLTSKEQFGRSLLHVAVIKSKEIETHKILWKKFRETYKNNEEFMRLIEEVDNHGNNIFHHAAAYATSEIFEFMISELEKIEKYIEIVVLLESLGPENYKLFQYAVIYNKNLEAHKTIWQVISRYFEPIEILEFIEYCDSDGDNLFCNVVLWNTKEIVEFTWNQIKIFKITKDAQFEYLNRRGHFNKSLRQLSLENVIKDLNVAVWLQQIMNEYKIEFQE